ncbi:MAG TPA: SDR family NAD(P)-dependent oxidoreductase, partial [Marmoricola sp.]|nr:SDR family NAD(P)-dependent oxidoreductase [Marmoricola sp.]
MSLPLVGNLLLTPTAFVRRHLVGRIVDLPSPLAGRTVLVTGASSGIGEATARAVASRGGTVLLVARRAEELERVRAGITADGGTASAYICDLVEPAAVDALVVQVLADHGAVDMLVNNAGRSIRRSLEYSYDRIHDFERTMAVNYFGPVRLTMGLLPAMVERENGQVINISSWAAMLHPARFSGYTASKAALEAWSDCVQGEVLDDGIVFTNVRMPLVRTPMITPTKLYSRMPALTMGQAADVVCDAVVSRSRRVTPLVAAWAAFA